MVSYYRCYLLSTANIIVSSAEAHRDDDQAAACWAADLLRQRSDLPAAELWCLSRQVCRLDQKTETMRVVGRLPRSSADLGTVEGR